MEYSDYIVYVDESGSPHLHGIDQNYPIFALAFCIFNKKQYTKDISPSIQDFKFKHFGHDAVILHENEMRKKTGHFNKLYPEEKYTLFMDELAEILEKSPMTVISSVVHKLKHLKQYHDPADPYALSLHFCIERTMKFLKAKGQTDKTTYLIVEKRGAKEDAELELAFRRICDHDGYIGKINCLEILFVDKKANSAGLQLADLVARPIGLSVLKPGQENRAYNLIKKKFRKSSAGKIEGYGLKIFP